MSMEAYLEDNLPRYLALLREWVETNSFTANPAGVDAVGDLTATAFTAMGFSAERVPAQNPDYGNHLVLTREGTWGQKIGMISHLDTVFPPEEEIANDFHWRVDGDRIYGPGTNDVKGGTLMIFMVLEALQRFSPDEFEAISWVVLLNAAEETLSPDFGVLCHERLGKNALAALVFEAGQYEDDTFMLVTQRKGRATYQVQVEGKSSHAGSKHELGANAIVQLAQTVCQIAGLTDYTRNLTFNVGTIEGGVVINRVPHHAQASGEMRTFEPEVYDQAIADLLALAETPNITSADGFPCSITIKVQEKTAPWPQNPATENLFAIWEQASDELGYKLIREARGGLSDGNHTWDTLPTIDGLGPSGANGHCSERSEDGSKDQEYANLSSFIPKAILNFHATKKLIKAR